mmetsp:Transcript_52702/g.115533  ORF Transcript_52702/g.115533 Transcript_52702/m.115533 type:complete len:211 (+) Transcript_52702:381-1013(+)
MIGTARQKLRLCQRQKLIDRESCENLVKNPKSWPHGGDACRSPGADFGKQCSFVLPIGTTQCQHRRCPGEMIHALPIIVGTWRQINLQNVLPLLKSNKICHLNDTKSRDRKPSLKCNCCVVTPHPSHSGQPLGSLRGAILLLHHSTSPRDCINIVKRVNLHAHVLCAVIERDGLRILASVHEHVERHVHNVWALGQLGSNPPRSLQRDLW